MGKTLRRLGRWAFNFAAAVSLLLAVFVAVLWATTDGVNTSYELHIAAGRDLSICAIDRSVFFALLWKSKYFEPASISALVDHGWSVGFNCLMVMQEFGHHNFDFGMASAHIPGAMIAPYVKEIQLPDWFLFILFFMLPGLFLQRLLRKRPNALNSQPPVSE